MLVCCWNKKKAECKSACGQRKGPVTREEGSGTIWSKKWDKNVYNVKLHPIIEKLRVLAEFGLFL